MLRLTSPSGCQGWDQTAGRYASNPQKSNLVKGSKDLGSFGDNLLHYILRWLLPERSIKNQNLQRMAQNGPKLTSKSIL
jgi:hypothetical protein